MAEPRAKRKYTVRDPAAFAASRAAGGRAAQVKADPEDRKRRSAAGGKARLTKLTDEKRSDVARAGARARNAAR